MKTFQKISPLFFLLFPVFIHAQVVPPSYADVSYANDTSEKHKLDVFIPSGISAPAPCVVHIHDEKLLNAGPCTPTEISPVTSLRGVKIFPNPVADVVHVFISSTSTQPFVLSIFDLPGNEISAYHFFSQTDFSFSAKNLENGIYFYRATNLVSGGTMNGKLLIEKK